MSSSDDDASPMEEGSTPTKRLPPSDDENMDDEEEDDGEEELEEEEEEDSASVDDDAAAKPNTAKRTKKQPLGAGAAQAAATNNVNDADEVDDDNDDENDAAVGGGGDDDDDDDEEQDEDEPPSFATALGLHRVGSKPPVRPQSQQPVQVLNARGMPARIRKRNKLFFDDNIVNDRPQRTSPAKRSAHQSAAGQRAGAATTTSHSASPQKITPSKLLKKRKGVVSRYMKIKEETKKKLLAEQQELEAAAAVRAATRTANTTIGASTVTETKHNNTHTTTAAHASGANTAPNAAAAAPTTSLATIKTIDRKCFERIGLRLRNLLKLPKAHKWVSYEWFYSYIDRPLFDGPNDFQICLRESFPQLRTRQLTRAEWSHCRSLMGKPRRCSPAFFAEERAELERRRHKIRVLQSTGRKTMGADAEYVRHLPAEIPLALPLGTKVTARLRVPQDGIFTGTVTVVDSETSTYRIEFDREGLGTHSVQDIDLLANDYAEMLPLASVVAQEAAQQQLLQRSKGTLSAAAAGGMNGASTLGVGGNGRKTISSVNRNDPLLGSEIFNNSNLRALVSGGGSCAVGGSGGAPSSGLVGMKPTVGGFHLKLLELMIRTRKSLVAKEMKLLRLKNMNSEAEMCRSFGEPLPDDYQRRYASIVIGMEKLNRDMQDYLAQIQSYTGDLTKDKVVAASMVPSYMRERCKELAAETVQKNNTTIKDEHMLRMLTDLATIMWVASNMPTGGGAAAGATQSAATGADQMTHVNRVLEVCLEESRGRLVDASNVETFQKNVQVHMRHLEMDLRQGGAAQLGANPLP